MLHCFPARRKASFASGVQATGYPSVRLSVRHTSVLCQNSEGCGLHRREPSVSSLLMPRMVDGGRPCPGKIWVQRGRPPVKTAELYTFRLITPEP